MLQTSLRGDSALDWYFVTCLSLQVLLGTTSLHYSAYISPEQLDYSTISNPVH